MKPFESFLATRLEAYIAYRTNLGFSHKDMRTHLLPVDRYLKKRNADWQSLQPGFFLELRAELKQSPRTANLILSRTKNFFQFLMRQDDLSENPLKDIPSVPQKAFVPFVFTPEQIEQILQELCKRLRKTKRYYLKDLGLYTAIFLIARCGLRISEPMGLQCGHYRPEDGTLYIEKTKFRKDRLIPVPRSVLEHLENYLAVRKAFIETPQNPYLFIGEAHNGLSTGKIYRFFHPAVKAVGIHQARETLGDIIFGAPNIHSLRHSFAINTLKQIRTQGKSVQYALPVLAVYMGHCKYQYTGAYLKVLSADHRQGLIEFAKSQRELK